MAKMRVGERVGLAVFAERGGAKDVIAEQTRANVFAAILSGGPLSRVDVALRTGLSPSTITKVVTPLIEAGYVVEAGPLKQERGLGRPQRGLAVNPNRHVVVGVRLHPSRIEVVGTDMQARVVARTESRLPSRRPEVVLDCAARAIAELFDAMGPGHPSVLGIGVAVGGHIDLVGGVCLHSGVLGWHGVDVAGPLVAVTGLPVVVSNDTNALCIAERWFGNGRGSDSFAVVTVGTGIGCGLFIRGKPYLGATGLAGEFGHLPLAPDGPRCSCGRSGCLETVASWPAILRSIAEHGGPRLRSIRKAARLARDDVGPDGKAARAAFTSAGEAIGRGLAALCNLVNPQKIVLSGEGVHQYDLFGTAMRESFDAHGFSTATSDCELIVHEVDDDLWARGAASVAIYQAVGGRTSGHAPLTSTLSRPLR